MNPAATLTKKQLYLILLVLGLIIILPLILISVRQRQEIRPKAVLSGVANFRLNATTTNINVGDSVTVMVSVELTDANVRASGVDFVLLYDKNKLQVTNVSPILGNNFTDSPIVDSQGQPYISEGNGAYNFLRVALISNKANTQLPGGTISLANFTFQGTANGAATIKFPDDNSKLQVVGTTL